MNVQLYRQRVQTSTFEMGVPAPDGTPDGSLTYTAKQPTRGSHEAAGYDIHAFLPPPFKTSIFLEPLMPTIVPTGLFIAEEMLSVVLVCCRSGLASKGVLIPNAPGIIDSDYRGEIKVIMMYVAAPGSSPFVINHGERIAQLLFLSPGKVNMDVTFEDVESQGALRPTGRGVNGFGSTGR